MAAVTIIVTVDSTGYVGPIIIGAMVKEVDAGGSFISTVYFEKNDVGITNTPHPLVPNAPQYNNVPYYTHTLDLPIREDGKNYMIYAMANTDVVKLGGCVRLDGRLEGIGTNPVCFVLHGMMYT